MQNKSFNIRVKISPEVINQLKNFQLTNDFEKEYGGILIGLFNVKERSYIISDITWPQKEDIQNKYQFIRKDPAHQLIMDQLWEKSNYLKCYMGEWHSHREAYPSPSFIDKKSWKKSAKNQNNFDVTFFLILGMKELRIWMVSSKTKKIVDLLKVNEHKEGGCFDFEINEKDS